MLYNSAANLKKGYNLDTVHSSGSGLSPGEDKLPDLFQ